MRSTRLLPGATLYPAALGTGPNSTRPPVLSCRGDTDLLQLPLLGLLSSSAVPPDVVLPALDLMIALRTAGTAVAGGFQSPVERECLSVLLGGDQPVVMLPARAVEGVEVGREAASRIERGSLLLISTFPERVRRPSTRQAMLRNELLRVISDRLLVLSAGAGSRTLKGAAEALEAGKQVFCFDHRRNRDLLLLGAWPLERNRRLQPDPALLTPASPASR